MTKDGKDESKFSSEIITNDLFVDFLNCPQKLHLRFQRNHGHISEYIALQNRLAQEYRERARLHFLKTQHAEQIASPPTTLLEVIANRLPIATDVTVTDRFISTRIDALLRNQHHATSDPPIYVPILFVHRKKPSKIDKMLLAYSGFVLSKQQRFKSEFGTIIHGPRFTSTKVRLESLYETVRRTLRAVQQLRSSDQAPLFTLISTAIFSTSNDIVMEPLWTMTT